MTTPGGGDNEITFVTRVVSGGDEREVARRVGQEAQQGYREGVEAGGPARLPGIDTSRLYEDIDAALTRAEARVASAARNMGMHLQEATGGTQMRLTGHDLAAEWDRYAVQMEQLGARMRSNFVGSWQQAIQNDLRIMERGYDFSQTTARNGRPLNWAMNEEGRQALSYRGQRFDPGAGTESHFQGSQYPTPPSGRWHGEAYEPGDLERVREAGMKAIGRITLDDATYAFENGEFFRVSKGGGVLRARGAIEDPATLQRLQQATIAQLTAAEDAIVREHIGQVAGRDPRFAQFGVDPTTPVRAAGGITFQPHDMMELADEGLRGGIPGLIEALDVLRAMEVEAPRLFSSLQTALVRLMDEEGAAARATEQQARATREAAEEASRLAAIQSRLTAAYAHHDDFYGNTANTRAGLSLIRQAQDRAYDTYAPNVAAGGAGSGGKPPLPPRTAGWGDDEFDEDFYRRAAAYRQAMAAAAAEEAAAQRLIALAQERAFGTYAGNVHATARREHFESGGGQAEYQRLMDAQRDEAAARRAASTPIGRLGAAGLAQEQRDNAYAENQAVRRALGEQVEAARTVTLTQADLARRAQRLGQAMEETAATLSPTQSRLRGLEHLPGARVGDVLTPAEQDRLGRTSNLGGTTTVRLGENGDQYATVTASRRLAALSETEALTRAERELAQATETAAAAARTEQHALNDMTDAQLRAFIAAQRLASAEVGTPAHARALLDGRAAARALRQEEQAGQGGIGGFFSGIGRGLTMARGAGEQGENNAFLRMRAENGEFLGAIARYQAAYAVIFGLSQGFSALVSAEVQAQDQMVEFSHATHTAGEGATQLANEMGRIGGQAGFSVAQSMAAATRGMYAFQNQASSSEGRASIARESVQQAANIRLIAPSLDPNQAQQQLLAATNGFNLGFEGQARVLDAAYNAMQNYGGAVEETIAALPTLSQVAEQAGLSVEEMANLVSVAVSRTAMNGTGIASLLNRTFGNLNAKPQIRNMLEEAGVDASGSAGQVIYNLAGAWDTLTKAQQNAIMAQLGGHEVARALLPILNEGSNLLDANAKSYEQVGSAAELVREKQANIAGTIRAIQGELQNFGRALVDTGMFDLLGGAIQLITPFLEGVNDVLRLISLLPGSTERWAFRLAEVLAVLYLIGRAQARNLAAQAAQNAATGTQLALETGVAGAQTAGAGGLFRGGLRATGGRAAGAAGGFIGTLGTGLAGLLTGVSGAIIGFAALGIAIGGTVRALHRHEEAENAARRAVLGDEETGVQAFGAARTPEELRAVASRLGQAAEAQAGANSGFFGGMFASRADKARAEDLLELSKYASEQAKRLAAGQDNLHSGLDFGAYFGNSGNAADDLARGLQSMTQAGVPAAEMLNNMASAFGRLRATEPQEPGLYYNEQNVSNLAQAAAGAVQRFKVGYDDVIPDFSFVMNNPQAAGAGAMPDVEGATEKLQTFNPKKVQDAINKALSANNVTPGEVIDEPMQARLTQAVLDNLGVTNLLEPEAADKLRAAVRAALSGEIAESSKSPLSTVMDEASFNRLLLGEGDKPGILQGITQSNAGFDPRRLDSQEGIQAARVSALRAAAQTAKDRGFDGAGAQAVADALAQAEHDLVQSQIARMERLRRAALVGIVDPSEIKRINTTSTIQQAKAAIDAGDEAALLQVMNDAADSALDAVRAMLQKALRAAQAAYDAASRITIPEGTDPSDIKFYNMSAAINSEDEAEALEQRKRDLDNFDNTRKQRVPSGSDLRTADEANPDALALARINSRAVAGDPVSQARTAREAAKYTLDHAKTETERLNALKAYNDANRQYTEAVNAVSQAQQRANARPGNALEQARATVAAATTALRGTVRGTAEWYNAQASLAAAQDSLQQVLLTARHQRRLRNTDLTDDVAMAREDLRAAIERRDYVKRTGNGNLDEEENNVRAAQNRAEASAFERRFNDARFAYDMGRMSHQAYMQYLNGEHNRLTAITNRTRQQTEELQQIDQAIKAAADAMQGQWNIGDIRIPTPYEARRFIERSSRGAEYQQGAQITNTQTNNISFSGLSRQEVEAIIRSTLGSETTQRTATTARKV